MASHNVAVVRKTGLASSVRRFYQPLDEGFWWLVLVLVLVLVLAAIVDLWSWLLSNQISVQRSGTSVAPLRI
jgi:hypothetical protein